MNISLSKNALVLSLIGHLAIISILGFSFGPRFSRKNCPRVFFWGAVLPNTEFAGVSLKTAKINEKQIIGSKSLPNLKPEKDFYNKANQAFASGYYLKPNLSLAFQPEKAVNSSQLNLALIPPKKREAVVMFYPQLPYNFRLYFQDRQNVHIELSFRMDSQAPANSLSIKRKVSSGNLEADLLSMRYLSRYLYVQQARVLSDNWQTVKIDFSPNKNQ